jgi:hypothetical protein
MYGQGTRRGQSVKNSAVVCKLAHVVGENRYIVLDGELEAVLGIGDSIEAAMEIAKDIEARNLAFNFEQIYDLYPRKVGKSTGIKWLKTNIKSRSRYEKLNEAVRNFASYTEAIDTETPFIPHFSTWVKRFEDWTDENAPELCRKLKPQIKYAPPSVELLSL